MSSSNERSNLGIAKYDLTELLLSKVFKYSLQERNQTITNYCLKNSMLHKAQFTYIMYAGVGYYPNNINTKTYKPLSVHIDLVNTFKQDVVNVSSEFKYAQALAKAYIAACLSKSSRLEVGRSYLIDCLKEGPSVDVDEEVKASIENTHAEAIQIIKTHLAMALLT